MKNIIEFRTVRELMQTFDTEQKCKEYLIELRWNGNPECPHCKSSDKIYQYKDGRLYKCSSCKKQFTVTTNMIFHGSHISLRDWFYALYIFLNHKKGISSIQLGKDLGITQKSAWLMTHKIRDAMKDRSGKLFGDIEVDETYVGGKNRNRHANKKVKHSQGRSTKDKTPIYGFVERGGRVRTLQIGRLHGPGMRLLLTKFVDKRSNIYTDEFRVYNGLDRLFNSHNVVNHSAHQYVSGNSTTNTIESFWSHLKRGIIGIYHKTSRKLLYRYCHEFEFRWNTRKENQQTRFELALMQSFGRKLSWKQALINPAYPIKG